MRDIKTGRHIQIYKMKRGVLISGNSEIQEKSSVAEPPLLQIMHLAGKGYYWTPARVLYIAHIKYIDSQAPIGPTGLYRFSTITAFVVSLWLYRPYRNRDRRTEQLLHVPALREHLILSVKSFYMLASCQI